MGIFSLNPCLGCDGVAALNGAGKASEEADRASEEPGRAKKLGWLQRELVSVLLAMNITVYLVIYYISVAFDNENC